MDQFLSPLKIKNGFCIDRWSVVNFLLSRDALSLWRGGRACCREVRMRAKYGHCANTKRGGHCTEMTVNGGSTALCK